MGVSWMVMHMLAWLWLTDMEGFSALLGSKIEDLVDKSAGTLDADTMFGRLEIIICHLPEWLLPQGFNLEDTGQRMKLWWRNPENGNMFVGESSTAGFGRQRRHTVGVADEFDHWQHAAEAIGAIRESCGSVWLITTPNRFGEQTARRVVEEGAARQLDLSWELHPEKTRKWYEEHSKDHLTENIATEIDLSWDGNKTDLIYPEYERVPKGDYPFRVDWPLYGSIDFGRSDGCGMLWLQRSPKSLRTRVIAAHYNAGYTIEHYLPYMSEGGRMHDTSDSYTAGDLKLISKVKEWYRASRMGIEWFGDPAGHQKPMNTSLSVIETLQENGIYVATNTRFNTHEERQARTHSIIRNMEVNLEDCAMLNWSMARYKRPPDKGMSVRERNNKPIHKRRVGEIATALEYYSVNVTDEPGKKKETAKKERHKAAYE
jgi:hypothetical protein